MTFATDKEENKRLLFAVLFAVLMTTYSDFPTRLTASPARENTFPLDLALPAESHCSLLTMLTRHGHSTSPFPPSYHLPEVTMTKGCALLHQWKTKRIPPWHCWRLKIHNNCSTSIPLPFVFQHLFSTPGSPCWFTQVVPLYSAMSCHQIQYVLYC